MAAHVASESMAFNGYGDVASHDVPIKLITANLLSVIPTGRGKEVRRVSTSAEIKRCTFTC